MGVDLVCEPQCNIDLLLQKPGLRRNAGLYNQLFEESMLYSVIR